MTMHLDNRFSTINTKKFKAKITKGKLKELELRWRQHNKRMKQNHMHAMHKMIMFHRIQHGDLQHI